MRETPGFLRLRHQAPGWRRVAREDLVTLDVELPAGVEPVGVEGEEWHCEPGEGRLTCFSRLEVFEPGQSSALLLVLKSTGEKPGEGCARETPCNQLCVLAEPEEDDNPEDNRACLLLGSKKQEAD